MQWVSRGVKAWANVARPGSEGVAKSGGLNVKRTSNIGQTMTHTFLTLLEPNFSLSRC